MLGEIALLRRDTMMLLYVAVILFLAATAAALDNGLGRTPPMGWMSWERFRCNIDCKNDPKNCISERLYKEHADALVSGGYRELGYTYVNLDDCWMSWSRDARGRLQPDPQRFPSGIRALADYMHARGLKFGIYTAVGNGTCQGYPASRDHWVTDAQTFAEWDVDSVKMDGCHNPDVKGWSKMSTALNKTGRPMLYMCEWPLYDKHVNFSEVAEKCNVWRTGVDIQDSWQLVQKVIDQIADNAGGFLDVSGPGRFNDPDMLLVGDYGLSLEQQRSQFAMWALFPAPLHISTDLRSIAPAARDILLSRHVVSINQDPLGLPAARVYKKVKTWPPGDSIEVWHRRLSVGYAICVLARTTYGEPQKFSDTLSNMGLRDSRPFRVYDAFEWSDLGVFTKNDNVTLVLNPSGVRLLRLLPLGA